MENVVIKLPGVSWTRLICQMLSMALLCHVCSTPALHAADPVALFDGKTFTGWEGDTTSTWRIEEGSIVAGSLKESIPRNEFLCTEHEYGNFELTLQFKLTGTDAAPNAGIQFRSQRIPDHHEMIGYQADIGPGYYGAIYDESRRNKVLAGPSQAVIAKLITPGQWHDYRIRCEGPHIRLWINETLTSDYTEPDSNIPQTGKIALQIHGGAPTQIEYRKITLTELAE